MLPKATVSFYLSSEEIRGILDGSVDAIFRTHIVGRPFDVFHIEGRAFHIVSVCALGLEVLAESVYRDSGYSDPGEFIDALVQSIDGVSEDAPVYTHHVAECTCDSCVIRKCERRAVCERWRGWSPC